MLTPTYGYCFWKLLWTKSHIRHIRPLWSAVYQAFHTITKQFYNSWWSERPNHQLSWVPKFVSSSRHLHFIMIPVLLVLGWSFQTRHRWGMDVLRPRAVYPVVVQWKIAACSNNGNLGFLRTSSAHRIACSIIIARQFHDFYPKMSDEKETFKFLWCLVNGWRQNVSEELQHNLCHKWWRPDKTPFWRWHWNPPGIMQWLLVLKFVYCPKKSLDLYKGRYEKIDWRSKVFLN